MAAGFERFVGWRYLLRTRRRPAVLVAGLSLVALGALALFGGHQALGEDFAASIFGGGSPAGRVVLGLGGALIGLGACTSLFGVLNLFLTAFSAFSAFMVAIGVMVVILVLGVMNGFQADLRTKIIDTQAHVVIEPAETGAYLADYRDLAERARGVPEVLGATPYLQTEVMLTSRTNLQPALLKGIEVATVVEANRLPSLVKEGDLESLDDPSRVKPFDLRRHPALRDEADTRQRDLEQRIAEVEAQLRAAAPEPAPAVDPDLEAAGMALPAPRRRDDAASPTVLLGIELRRNLGLWPGEALNVVSPLGDLGPNGPVPRSRPFRLAGWFESGMLEFDTRFAYASLSTVQRYLGLEDVAGAIQVRVKDLDRAREVRDRLQTLLGPSVRVSDWQQLNRNLFSALELEKIAMFLVLSMNILLAAFAITLTLLIAIRGRRRQIAILNAIGAPQAAVLRIFIAQGAFTGAIGACLGAACGVGLGLALSALELPMDGSVYYLPSIPVDVRARDVLAIMAVAQLISVLSTLHPARYAARMKPVQGLVME